MIKNYFLVLLFVPFLTSCTGSSSPTETTKSTYKPLEFFGNTQGTTFSVICNDSINLTANEIEEILFNFDLALSSYIPNSVITHLNEAEVGEFVYSDPYKYFNRFS